METRLNDNKTSSPAQRAHYIVKRARTYETVLKLTKQKSIRCNNSTMAMGATLYYINVTERHYNNQNLNFRIQNELESNDEHVELNSILGIQKSSMLSH